MSSDKITAQGGLIQTQQSQLHPSQFRHALGVSRMHYKPNLKVIINSLLPQDTAICHGLLIVWGNQVIDHSYRISFLFKQWPSFPVVTYLWTHYRAHGKRTQNISVQRQCFFLFLLRKTNFWNLLLQIKEEDWKTGRKKKLSKAFIATTESSPMFDKGLHTLMLAGIRCSLTSFNQEENVCCE